MDKKRCIELSEQMDELSDIERKFILYYILPDFIKETEEYIKKEAETKIELLARMKAREHLIAAKEIKEMLGYELW